MKIAFVSPEVYPFAKTGGLADVSYSLPRALAAAGHEVSVFLPGYGSIDRKKFGFGIAHVPLIIKMYNEEKYAAVLSSGFIPGINSYLIDYEGYFGRDGLYGYPDSGFADNAERYDFFAGAVLEGIKALGFFPDIIHCNDWQTGLIPFYLKTKYRDDDHFSGTAPVITVHNAGYRGIFSGYSPVFYSGKYPPDPGDDMDTDIPAGTGFLRAGVLCSDAVTTVSRKYAEEIQTREFGYEMAVVFRAVKDRLYGVSNAVDYELWDPALDGNIPRNYSAEDLSGKAVCKAELQKRMGLPEDPGVPLLGTIARIAYQKGMDVLASTLELLMQDEEFQFIIMGDGDRHLSARFDRIQRMFPQSVAVFHGYEEGLAHLAEAGLDMFIMPSRYEPCGLNQLYSLKYGTVPVVRSTGGLDEAIVEWEGEKATGNGFKFRDLTQKDLYGVIRKAVRVYKDGNTWRRIQRNGMEYNYSWADAVKEYERVYECAKRMPAGN